MASTPGTCTMARVKSDARLVFARPVAQHLSGRIPLLGSVSVMGSGLGCH